MTTTITINSALVPKGRCVGRPDARSIAHVRSRSTQLSFPYVEFPLRSDTERGDGGVARRNSGGDRQGNQLRKVDSWM